MFDIMNYFKKSNHEILQSAINKNLMVSFNESEKKLHDAMFGNRSIIMVEQEYKEKPEPPEPGEPEIIVPDVRVEHNEKEGNGLSYMFIDKTFFESLEQQEVDELIYQLFSQGEFNRTAQYIVDMVKADSELLEVNVDVEVVDLTETEEEEKSKEAKESGACEMAESAKEAEKEIKSGKSSREVKMKVQDLKPEDKEKNPRFKAGNASFKKGTSTNSAKKFRRSNDSSTFIGPDDSDIKEIAKVQTILEHAIKGDNGGKIATISPSKKLNMKAIITESSEKEYIGNRGEEGKDIKINMIIDRSGSMSGAPTKNSNILVEALNNLAFEYEELDIKIIYSETSNYFGYDLPVDGINSKEIWAFDRTGSAEGLHRTFNAHFDRIKQSDINLVYTDGSIMDENIDKAYMKSQEIELTGLYVNSEFTPEDVMRHVEQNSQYFTRTIIRKTPEALVNELANMLVMQKGNH